jgi:hypothetical protein
MNKLLNKNIFGQTLVLLFLLTSCSKVGPDSGSSTSLAPPAISLGGGNYIVRSTAEFDVTSTPDESAQWHLVKKSYASGTCTHGQCTDFSDITVTNTANTNFQINDSQQLITQTVSNTNLTNFLNLDVVTLFDNDLFECSGTQKCTGASILGYITSTGDGLYNTITGQSIPLLVSSPYSSTNVPLGTLTVPTILQQITIPASQQTVSLINLGNTATNGPNYTLSSDFTTAGVGTFTAHVVIAYALNGYTAPQVDHFSIAVTAPDAGTVETPQTTNTITVSALSATNTVLTGYVGTVTITSSDPTNSTFTPTTHQFTSSDAGVYNFSLVYSGSSSNYTISVTDSTQGVTSTTSTEPTQCSGPLCGGGVIGI